ncbi:hypothetical protein Mal64_18620 [Pseudobythopirellula maris]|uniref:Uncharacterized protein n=1 Tax=Pseudobythopirellula maris TaxID=2527991 RepID=A0A5C5ZLQ6_9BACT|nr:hypothetical protein [Pseudobythopirellula maris]TWT88382.1 hypothetical protein Mal64_18620 [Pseudobythopirellula maris]
MSDCVSEPDGAPDPWRETFPTFFAARECAADVVRSWLSPRTYKQAVAKADLPLAVAETVSETVRRTRLWRGERIAVADELVSHFQEGLASGQSPEALVADFGEPRTAARLMRRGKVRNRPRVWQAWWWASRGALAGLALYALFAMCLLIPKPVVSVNYLKKLNAPAAAVPEDDRAWPLYLDAFRIVAEEQRFKREAGDPQANFYGWEQPWASEPLTATTRPAAEAWIAEHVDFIEKLRAAASKPRLGVEVGFDKPYRDDFAELEGGIRPEEPAYEDFGGGLQHVLLDHVQQMRAVARVLMVDAQLSADGRRVSDDIEAMLGVAKQSGEVGFYVSALVMVSIDRMAWAFLEDTLRNRSEVFNDEQLKRLAHLAAASSYDATPYLATERLVFLDLVQRLYCESAWGGGHLDLDAWVKSDEWRRRFFENERKDNTGLKNGLVRKTVAPLAFLVTASRSGVVAKYDELSARVRSRAQRPLWETSSRGDYTDSFDEVPLWQRLRYPPITLWGAGINIGSVPSVFHGARGLRDGALVGIALELLRREHGGWPESLDQLAPRWLPELPVDRINGGPLGYRLVDGQPVVYSLGVDRDDDGGLWPSRFTTQTSANLSRWQIPYVVRPPIDNPPAEEDGDWVIWSLAPPRYMPSEADQPHIDGEP